MNIKFCGAVDGVTGSCHLLYGSSESVEAAGEIVKTKEYAVLLDCGQFQGSSKDVKSNAMPFPFDIEQIDFVILSHAHIDHCGRLPLMYKRGYRNSIYCTKATADLLSIMLLDSAHIHEKEAEWKNKKAARSGGETAVPLFTEEDALRTLSLVVPVLYDQLIEPIPQVKFIFNDAGHILGAAIVEVWTIENDIAKKLVFTGDLGVSDMPILNDPVRIKRADYLIMESTYGNRLHEKSEYSASKLIDIIRTTTKKGGTVIIPSFAVGRTQELIYEIAKAFRDDEVVSRDLADVYFYIDSPMAKAATQTFRENIVNFDEEAKKILLNGDDPLDFINLRITETTEDSKALNLDKTPKVVISASGMCDAGRIKHHLKHNIWDDKNAIVFVGYQAQGTLGRRILDGDKVVKIFNEDFNVNATIYDLNGFSGHADMEDLMNWLKGFVHLPKEIFLVHGETESKQNLARLIKEELERDAIVLSEIIDINLNGYLSENEEQFGIDEAMRERIDSEHLEELREKLMSIHNEIESILYYASLKINKSIEPKDFIKLQSIVANIEKYTFDLGESVAKKA